MTIVPNNYPPETYSVNKTISSLTINFNDVSTVGGIDCNIGNYYAWITYDGSDMKGQWLTSGMSVSSSGKSITFTWDKKSEIDNISFHLKDTSSNWSISSITTTSPEGYSPLPHRPTRSLPKIATPTDSTQYVLRLGNLVQAQQSAESQNTSVSQVVTGTPKMRRMQANAASWQNVTLTSNGNWSEEITLPMYDTNGNKYYYWLAENSVPAGYTASYKFEGGGNSYCIDATATNPQITVKNTPLTEGSVELPTSGGSGTAPYRTAGFLLMMTAVTFPYIKHRNRRKRNSA